MVTGAASGIGRGISIRLAEMGAFVAILDIDETKDARAPPKSKPGRLSGFPEV